MMDFFGWLFSSENFMPHGHCYLWQPATLWLNVGSDAMIATSYFAIPAAIYYFVRRRQTEIAYFWVLLMFAAFILLCGATHVMEIVTVWHPQYRVEGAIKLLTGLVSFATVVTLVWIMPHAMLLKTPRQLQAEVSARTAELAAVNRQLQAEVAARAAAQEELRLADVRKDEFLATLAHELRNPLAPIRHSLKLLNRADLESAQREWAARVISRQVHRMALMLDDLLDISQITRSRLELKVERVDLGSLIATAVETATPLIEQKAQTLRVDLPVGPLTVAVDPLRISQSIANLLSNAAKYSAGGADIALMVAAGAAGELSVVVKDTGIGFEASDVPAMFQMFSRVATTGERETGLGIGLALVRQLIALHGGTVEASSPGPGKGSEFTIHLPGAVVGDEWGKPALTPSMPSISAEAGGKILVVDDNRDSADALSLVLAADGYDVIVGYCGIDALQLARQSQPAAIILDIGMADMTGYEVARRLRLEPWGRDVLLLAMTGWGQIKDKELARQAGFNRHFTKPVDTDDLERELAAFFDRPSLV
jgi:signal transduction histidine kinase/CheY-like chemotaxis protein